MNTKLISFLSVLCVICVLIIFGEWMLALWSQKTIMSSLVPKDIKVSQDEMPKIDFRQQTEESFADFVAKPLFIKGRKPIDEPSPEQVQAAAVPVVFDWELNGVYSTQKGLSAFLSKAAAKTAKERYRKLSQDGELDGWKLTEIYPNKVIFTQGAQKKELLLRKMKKKDGSKRPAGPNAPNIPPPDETQMPVEGETENSNE